MTGTALLVERADEGGRAVLDGRPEPASVGSRLEDAAASIADLAVRALEDEAMLTPKPGLVDLRGAGSHRDMSIGMMLDSARSLRLTFHDLARAGHESGTDADLRVELARIGRNGEAAMFASTHGVNTHRGAIWALGLASGAAGALDEAAQPSTPVAVLGRIASIASHDDSAAVPSSSSARSASTQNPTRIREGAPTRGSEARHHFRVGGAIGQARAGFPAARAALEALRARRAAGVGEDEARLDALLTSMSVLDDTCVLARGGWEGLALVRAGSAEVLACGGVESASGRRAFADLDTRVKAARLSPGGSADMLALALFLDSLESSYSVEAASSDPLTTPTS